MGGTSDRLAQRAQRRSEWLSSAAPRLEADPAVAVAWVFGSEGRGDADELSDLSLLVAVADVEGVLPALGEAWFAGFGEVRSFVEATDRAPEGGRCFVVAYPAPVEPVRVEWWFRGADGLQQASDAGVLVDRVGLVMADPPLATTSMLPSAGAARSGGAGAGAARRPTRRADRLQERVNWFWTAAPTVAKWLARGWVDRADPDLERMAGVVDEAAAFLNRQPSERYAEPGPVRPLARLRASMVELSMLSAPLTEAGLTVPSTDRAYGWLELAEDLEAERWVPNSTKETT